MRSSKSGFFAPRVLLGIVFGAIGIFLALGAFGISLGTSALAQGPEQSGDSLAANAKVSAEVLADTANGRNASIVILLTEQADVSAAYEMKDQDARGWFVYNTLTQHAARTQAGLKAFSRAQGAELPVILGRQHDCCDGGSFPGRALAARARCGAH